MMLVISRLHAIKHLVLMRTCWPSEWDSASTVASRATSATVAAALLSSTARCVAMSDWSATQSASNERTCQRQC